MKGKGKIVLYAGVALVALGYFGYRAVAGGEEEEAEIQITQVDEGRITISVVESGRLQTARSVEVKSRAAGRLSRISVDEGDFVEAGALIAVVDPEETEIQVQQARAQLDGAQSSMRASGIEIEQRRQNSQAQVERIETRVAQLRKDLEIQPTLTRTAIESAESQLITAQQDLDLLVSVTQRNERLAAQSAVQDAEGRSQTAARELERRSNLLEQGYISERDLEAAELDNRLALTALHEARQRLARLDEQHPLQVRNAEQRVTQARADLERARTQDNAEDALAAQLRQAEIDLRDARTALRDVDRLVAQRGQQAANIRNLQSQLSDQLRQLSETEIRAPISGIVTRRFVQEGELVANLSAFSDGTTIVLIENLDAMQVRLEVNEIDVAKLELGMPSDVRVDALANQRFQGTITKIAPAVVSLESAGDVVSYEVEVTLSDRTEEMKPGMSARCDIRVVDIRNATRIPIDYLGQDDEGFFVYLATEADKPDEEREKTRVVVAERTGRHAAIESGVEVGQDILRPPFSGPDRQGSERDGPGPRVR